MDIEVKVEWKKSKTWGMNPHAVAYHPGGAATAKASGCGYCKLSTVLAECLDQIPQVQEAALKNEASQPYGIGFFDNEVKSGRGKARVVTKVRKAFFPAGSGVSSVTKSVESIGGKVEHVSGKTWDYFKISIPV